MNILKPHQEKYVYIVLVLAIFIVGILDNPAHY